MIGTIIAVNPIRGWFAFECNGGYGWFELLGSTELNVGDQIKGNLENLGGETLSLVGTEERIDVSIENTLSSLNSVIASINQ